MDIIILALLVGIFIGFFAFLGLLKLNTWYELKKLKDDYNTTYLEVLEIIGSNSLKFMNRYNSNVTFRANLKKHGKVEIIFLMDKKDLTIFKNGECIYSSFYTDKKIVTDICSKLETSFSRELTDCVQVMGNIIDRRTITKLNPNIEFPPAFPVVEQPQLTMDDILDKINEVGIDNLTPDEKEFLKNQ